MSMAIDSVMEIVEGLFEDAELTEEHWEELQRKVAARCAEENPVAEENTGSLTVYAVSVNGLDLPAASLWNEQAEAEEYNEAEYEGQGTVYELTASLDWSKAIRVN